MSTMPMNKDAVARNFSSAATTYDAWAGAQRRIAAELVRRLPQSFRPSRMVDLGCGTGLLCERLIERYPAASLLGIDLAAGMVAHCQQRWRRDPRLRFVAGDVEESAMVVRDIELVACASSSQWFAAPMRTLSLWAASLSPGGVLAVASLIRGSFRELAAAYRRAAGGEMAGLAFAGEEAMLQLARESGLKVRVSEVQEVVAWHADARQALRAFSEMGAVLRGQPHAPRLSASVTRRLLGAYAEHAQAAGTPVTYRVQYFIAEKPA